MDDSGDVVIRDDSGTEHVFPTGFDPKRAAAIVRQRQAITPVSSDEPDTYAGGFAKSLADTAKRTGSGILEGLNPIEAAKGLVQTIAHPIDAATGAFQTVAHPVTTARSLSDPETGGKAIGNLILGGVTGRVLPHVPDAMVGGGKALEYAGEVSKPASLPIAIAEAAARGDVKGAAMIAAGPYAAKGVGGVLRKVGEALGGGERAAAPAAAAAPVDLSQPVRASALSPAEIRARVDAVRAQGGLPAATEAQMPTVRGTLRSSPAAPVAEAAQPAAVPQPAANYPTTVPDRVGSALDPARVDIGAEQAGRATGMTKQQVRDVATPILDAAPGEASPILPEKALKRIIDTIKELPKGGPEREAYVAKATSGKTQWQVENIRRTLEHLGLIVPVAAGGGMLRDTILQRLHQGETRQ